MVAKPAGEECFFWLKCIILKIYQNQSDSRNGCSFSFLLSCLGLNHKHMKNQYKLTLIICVFGLWSCSDFIDLEPETSLSSAVAFDNIEGIEAGINGAYSTLHNDWVERQIVFAECLANNVFEINTLGNSNYQEALRHQAWTDLFNISNYFWSMSYRAIDLSNQIITAIPDIPEPNQQITAEKTRLLGEAHFIRGLCFFVLNRFFAQPQNGLSVPLQITPYKAGDMPARGTIEETKDQVLADLEVAESLLDGIENNQGRATIWAVKALLARVHFEFKNYATAASYADDVILNGRVEGKKLALLSEDILPLYNGVITTENIFTFLATPRDRANTRLFEIFSINSSAVELSMSKSFWNIISENKNDVRLEQLHEDFRTAWACYKYNDRDMHIPYLRLSEMYLIRAESKVNTGDLDGALTDLNALRNRAGLDETTYTDQADLLDQLYRERSLELSMEGDNFHNLKRLEQPIGGYSWEEASYKLVFFLPEKEIQLNANLIQNDTW